MFMGRTTTYIYNTHRQKVDLVEESGLLHREFCQFDHTIETEITNYIQHKDITFLESTIRLNPLTEESPLQICHTRENSKNNQMHQNTPGASNIYKKKNRWIPSARTRLHHIFNAALARRYFPDRFKHATLIPKPAKSAHEEGNYCPISFFIFPDKLLERVISQILIPHLEHNQTHNFRQYGFRLEIKRYCSCFRGDRSRPRYQARN